MFERRKLRKLEARLEEAAIELTLAEKIGPPPGDPKHAGAADAIVAAARAAVGAGLSTDVAETLEKAETHPMFRGSEAEKWASFIGSVRGRV